MGRKDIDDDILLEAAGIGKSIFGKHELVCAPPSHIPPEEFYRKIGKQSLIELAALQCMGLEQDFNDRSDNSAYRYRLVNDKNLPEPTLSDWMFVCREGPLKTVGELKNEEEIFFKDDKRINKRDASFGPSAPYAFYIPVPPGFEIENITDKEKTPHYKGYDGIALFNKTTGDLIFVSKGADVNIHARKTTSWRCHQ